MNHKPEVVETDVRQILPIHNGLPVPWVTRWTKEVNGTAYRYDQTPDGTLHIFYEDGVENRERSGVLWQREGVNRGGEPQWAQVSTYRQRVCMSRRRCQVCGNKIEDKVVPWILPNDAGLVEQDGTLITSQPPTCSNCVPQVEQLCPHLKTKGYRIANVLEYEIWGVFGEAIVPIEGRLARTQSNFGYDEDYSKWPGFSLACVLAKQQLVKITKFAWAK